jgi:hypothetical protein
VWTSDFAITPEEREALAHALSNTNDVRVKRRISGILLLSHTNNPAYAASQAGLHQTTLLLWADRYAQTRSPETLFARRGKRSSTLPVENVTRLVEEALTSSPARHGYRGSEWVPADMRAHLWDRYGTLVATPVLERILTQRQVSRGGMGDTR